MKWTALNGVVLSILTLCMLHGAAGDASAMLLGTTGQGGAASTLYVVDQTTGTMTRIGDIGYAVTGMDYHNGKLYGVTSGLDPNFHGLITIDMTTGAGTPVGPGWGSLPGGSFVVAEMAIDSSGNAYGWLEPSPGALVPIHLATGTLGAPLAPPGNVFTAALGLAFDRSGNLFLIDRNGGVHGINTSDGVATPLGNLSTPGYAHHGDVDPATGTYWGLGTFPGDPRATLVSVDLDSLTVLSQVSAEFDLHTLAFSTEIAPDTAPPTVISTVPDSNGTGVSVRIPITVTFSETMDTASFTPDAFILTGGGLNIACSVNASGATATFTPSVQLAYGTPYTATVTTLVKDQAGNNLAADKTWLFTTVMAPSGSGGSGGGWTGGCSVSTTRRPDEESATGALLALLLPALILIVRKIRHRGHGRAQVTSACTGCLRISGGYRERSGRPSPAFRRGTASGGT